MTKDKWERRITIANILDLVLGVILFAYGFFKGVLQFHQLWFSLVAGPLVIGFVLFIEYGRRRGGGRAWKGPSP